MHKFLEMLLKCWEVVEFWIWFRFGFSQPKTRVLYSGSTLLYTKVSQICVISILLLIPLMMAVLISLSASKMVMFHLKRCVSCSFSKNKWKYSTKKKVNMTTEHYGFMNCSRLGFLAT